MANVTSTKAINQLRIQKSMKFGLNPKFTTTMTNEMKNVAIKLINSENFMSWADGLFAIIVCLEKTENRSA